MLRLLNDNLHETSSMAFWKKKWDNYFILNSWTDKFYVAHKIENAKKWLYFYPKTWKKYANKND